MGHNRSGERRGAMRVPVRGVAVFHTVEAQDHGPIHGALENLSQTGALISFSAPPRGGDVELELRLPDGEGWVTARQVRRDATGRQCRVGFAFERVDGATRDTIDRSIHAAMSAARRRPVLVIDDHHERRASLIERLTESGMTPLAPRTPLEAIDLLTRAQLHVNVCLLAPGFGVASQDLEAVLSDSFPWVTTTMISDDLEATAGRAIAAWSERGAA